MRYLSSKRIPFSAVKRNRPVRKRAVRLPSEDTSEVSCILKDRGLWQKLPAEVLVNIFHFLNDGERCRASLACKNWRDVFYVESLWRKRCFVFGDDKHEMAGFKLSKFISHFGEKLKDVTIEFYNQFDPITTRTITASRFEDFVTLVNDCRNSKIINLTIRSLFAVYNRQDISLHRHKVVRAVSSLLTRQCHLKSVDMVDCLFSLDDGLQVLKALAFNVEQRPTKDSLCRLRLDGFFEVQQNFNDVSLATFLDVTKSFQSLRYICMDQEYFREAVLQQLTKAASATLRTIDLVVQSDCVTPAISSVTWLEVTRRCPYLQIAVHFLSGNFDFASILVEHIPLREMMVSWNKITKVIEEDHDVPASPITCSTIVYVRLLVPDKMKYRHNVLTTFIEKFQELSTVMVESVKSLTDALSNTMAILSSQFDLWHVKNTVTNVSAEKWSEVITSLKKKWPNVQFDIFCNLRQNRCLMNCGTLNFNLTDFEKRT